MAALIGGRPVAPIIGVTDGSAAAAGTVGELLSATVASGSAQALTSDVGLGLTSIALTAGDWDLWGSVEFLGNAATALYATVGCINTGSGSITDATSGFAAGYYAGATVFAGTVVVTVAIPILRVNISSTTTYYLNAKASFTTNTCSGYGGIFARRRR